MADSDTMFATYAEKQDQRHVKGLFKLLREVNYFVAKQ